MERVCASMLFYANGNIFRRGYNVLHDGMRFAEEFVGLLATENGMHIDLELMNIASAGASWAMYTSFQFIMASQPILLANMSFAERFATAMRSNGWPAELFAATFRYDEPMMVATGASGAGRTALHWAAAHYGDWLKSYSNTEDGLYLDCDAMRNATSYANLAVELITKGSDLHACWNKTLRHLRHSGATKSKCKVSPFSSFLRGLSNQYQQYWNAVTLSDAVCRWGKLLVAAGQPLLEYVAMENEFLRATRHEMSIGALLTCHATELVLSEGDRLAMRVEHYVGVRMWKAKPTQVPGSWPRTSSLPNTITWMPGKEDAQEGYHWVPVETNRSRSYLVQAAQLPRPTTPTPISPDSSGSVCLESRKRKRSNLLYRIQDDHAFKAILLINQSEPRRRDRTYTRRRSASDPTIERQPGGYDNGIPIEPWCGLIHKCAFDLRWKVRQSSSPISCPERYCVQGNCLQPVGSLSPWFWHHTWEAELLKDERHVRVAGRFARRFCPEHLDLVEETLARATERSQLPIGPPRPPAKSR
jgi:hypothetical protein